MLSLWLSTQSLSQTTSSLAPKPSLIQHANFYPLQNHVLPHLYWESSCPSQDIWILFWTIQQRGTRVEKEVPRPREPYNKKESSPRTQLFPDQPTKRLHCIQFQYRLPRHQQYSRGSPSPSFQISDHPACMWSLQMYMSIRKLWPLVHRFRGHYLYLYRISEAHNPGDQICPRKKEIQRRRSRSPQIPADVSKYEHDDGKLFCASPFSSCYSTSFPDGQSECSNPTSRIDQQITANNAKAILKRRQLRDLQKKIDSYSELVPFNTGKFFQNFAPPPEYETYPE